jgi:hypothetical protein
MAKVKVAIEEILCKVFEVEVPDEVLEEKDTWTILEKAKNMYYDEEVVLTSDDFDGIKNISIVDDRCPTEWEDF